MKPLRHSRCDYRGCLPHALAIRSRPVYTRRVAAITPPPAPTAQGSFAKTPLPHLLVYALERALSGTFELRARRDSVARDDARHPGLAGEGPAERRRSLPRRGDARARAHHDGAALKRLSSGWHGRARALQGADPEELGASDAARVETGVRAQLERKARAPLHAATRDPLRVLRRHRRPRSGSAVPRAD